MAVLLADVFAFRADARAESLVPGGVLFVFVGALGDERLRVATAVVVVGVGAVTTAILRGYHADAGRDRAAAWRRSPTALAFGVVVALVAGFVGPRLPGADAAPLYETSGGGGGVAQVLSPLVDIRSRLTNRSTTELFRVRADAESYWRSSALPEFDGTTWGLPERELQPVGGPLDGAASTRSSRTANGSRSERSAARWCRPPPIPSRPPVPTTCDSWPRPPPWSPSTATSRPTTRSTSSPPHPSSTPPGWPPRRPRRHRTPSTPPCPTTCPRWSPRPHAR